MDGTKDTLKPTLLEQVKGIIWKILIEEKKQLVAVESRDPDNKQVYFSVFNYAKGLVLFKNITLHERWNLNIAHLGKDSLLIKVFPDEANPVNKGIIALNCETGDVNWEKYNIAFHDVWEEGLEVYNPDLLPRKSYLLDIRTGSAIDMIERHALVSTVLIPAIHDQTIIPNWLSHSEIVGHILHLQHNGKDILSFHEKSAENIRLKLLVFQDVVSFADIILKENIQKLMPEAFFIVQNHLFCIRGDNEIISYLI